MLCIPKDPRGFTLIGVGEFWGLVAVSLPRAEMGRGTRRVGSPHPGSSPGRLRCPQSLGTQLRGFVSTPGAKCGCEEVDRGCMEN